MDYQIYITIGGARRLAMRHCGMFLSPIFVNRTYRHKWECSKGHICFGTYDEVLSIGFGICKCCEKQAIYTKRKTE